MNDAFVAAINKYEATRLSATIDVAGCSLTYAVPNSLCYWRVQSLTSKEPITIDWLNSFVPGSAFLDVGANVGMYSIYAGVVRRAIVYSFEPEAKNYAILCQNIELNLLGERVVAWCAALSDQDVFDRIYLSGTRAGQSSHSFGEMVSPSLRPKEFKRSQGCYSTTIDALVASGAILPPNHIKIDVDGLEHKVIRGAAMTLRNPALKSMLVEINANLNEHRWIVAHLETLGFTHDPEQFARAQRTSGPFKGTGEYVFWR